MSAYLLSWVALVYLYVAATYLHEGRYGMAVAFTAYAISNLGFVWDVWSFTKH